MSNQNSVVIKLTQDQKNAIRQATGQDISELKVEALQGRVAAAVLEARKAPFAGGENLMDRKAPMAGGENLTDRKAPFAGGENLTDRKAPIAGGENLTDRKAPITIKNDE